MEDAGAGEGSGGGRRSERQIRSEGNKCSAVLFARLPRRHGDAQDNFELAQMGSVAGQVAQSAVFPLPLYSHKFRRRTLALEGPPYSLGLLRDLSQSQGKKERIEKKQ